MILDLDGLLIDSEIWSWQAHDAVLASLGLASLSAGEIAQMVGLIGQDEWNAIRALRPVPDMSGQYREAHTAAYLRIGAQHMAPMAGSDELLATASRLGLRVALASNSPLASAQSTLRSLGMLQHFAALATGDQVARSKPAADVYQLALRLLDEEPGRVLAIEDSAVGLRAASAAGLRCLAVPNSVTAGQDFTTAYRVFSSLHEVAAWLDGGELAGRLA